MWEVSVSFTDESESLMASKGYAWEKSMLGNVYYPKEIIVFEAEAEVNYVVYPWITKFETKGIRIIKKSTEE